MICISERKNILSRIQYDTGVSMYACVCVCICMYVFMYVSIYIIYVCVYVRIRLYVCMYVFMYVSIYMCLCMYICMYARMHFQDNWLNRVDDLTFNISPISNWSDILQSNNLSSSKGTWTRSRIPRHHTSAPTVVGRFGEIFEQKMYDTKEYREEWIEVERRGKHIELERGK